MHVAGRPEQVVTPAPGTANDEDRAAFERFVKEAGPRLSRALAAAYGFEDGRDATAEALAYAWENWRKSESRRTP
jgi:DNA-directed RNA polymerase specialized sigma24 family protein